ncbi:epoxyqueuosine reductase QueH [Candidatus Omnitrophota bacterium]
MRLLLHICCGPCAVYTVKLFRDKGLDVEGLFYNPNIHSVSEYDNRKDAIIKLAESINLKMHFSNDYQFEDFFRKITFHEKDGRCQACWKLRLTKTAEFASKNGFDGFTTTLLISPYQDHEVIRKIAGDLENKYSSSFIYEDLRIGFRESQRISKELGLYHQKYCGCIYSERERREAVLKK